MARLEANTSVFDLIVNRTGSIDNIIQFVEDEGLTSVNQVLLGFNTDPYSTSNFSTELKIAGRIVSTREISVSASTVGAFDKGFDIGFDIKQ